MTFEATLAAPSTAAAALSAARTARAAERRRPFDLRRGQADDDEVSRLDVAFDDLREAAVADAGAHLHRLELLVRRFVAVAGEEVDRLHLLRTRSAAAERAGRATEAALAPAHRERAAIGIAAARVRRRG